MIRVGEGGFVVVGVVAGGGGGGLLGGSGDGVGGLGGVHASGRLDFGWVFS